MKVTNEKTENREAYLTVEMDPSEVAESTENAYRRLVKQVNVPGFRKGRAPRVVLERHVGRERLVNDMLEELVPRAYEKAVEEQELDTIARPRIEVVETDPVVFKAVVPLRPVVKLGDYRQIRMAPEPVETAEDSVDAVIEQLRHQQATWEPVERAVRLGDLVTLDVASTIDGEPYINQKGAQYQAIAGSSGPAPGFAEQIAGMSGGEEKEFWIQFPEDYARSELAGREAAFRTTISEVKEEKLPEVTDDFARQVEAEIESVEQLRDRIRTTLQTRGEERARLDFEARAVEAVVEVSQVEFPPVLVEAEVHSLMDDQARDLQMRGLTLEQYLRTVGKTEEEMHEELHPVAEKRVAQSLILGRLSEAESVEVEDADIDAEISGMVGGVAEERREGLEKALNAPEARDSIRQTLLTRKTVQRLVEIVQGSGETETSEKEEE